MCFFFSAEALQAIALPLPQTDARLPFYARRPSWSPSLQLFLELVVSRRLQWVRGMKIKFACVVVGRDRWPRFEEELETEQWEEKLLPEKGKTLGHIQYDSALTELWITAYRKIGMFDLSWFPLVCSWLQLKDSQLDCVRVRPLAACLARRKPSNGLRDLSTCTGA